MATSNQIYVDQLIGHIIGLQRYGSGIINRLIGILNRTDPQLESLLILRLTQIEDRGGLFDQAGDRQLERILRAVSNIRSEQFTEFSSELDAELLQLMQYEAEYQANAIQMALPFEIDLEQPNEQSLRNRLSTVVFPANLPVPQRLNVGEYLANLQPLEERRIRSAITLGFQEGQSIPNIVRSIVGTRNQGFRDGTLQLTRNNVSTIVRTSVATMAQEARNEFFEQNKVSSMELWSAVLDGRTTFVCASRDGKVRRQGFWQRRYPAHFGERSVIIPILDGQRILGTRPSITDTRNRRRREIDFRQISRDTGKPIRQVRQEWADENIGQVPAEINFERWLRGRPKKFQRQYLGETRFRLFDRGNLDLDALIDDAGNDLTLTQLQRNDRQSFVDAGLID